MAESYGNMPYIMTTSEADQLCDTEMVMDSGATMTAGGDRAVSRLVAGVAAASPKTKVTVWKDQRP